MSMSLSHYSDRELRGFWPELRPVLTAVGCVSLASVVRYVPAAEGGRSDTDARSVG
jgi:hypothetical protein